MLHLSLRFPYEEASQDQGKLYLNFKRFNILVNIFFSYLSLKLDLF